MKKFFVAVLLIAAAAFVGYGVKYVLTPVNTQEIKYITQENSINTNGFIIRDEWVMTSRSAGTVYLAAAEGDRVAKDTAIVTLFYGDVPEDKIKELAVVDNKIKTAENDSRAQSVSDLDETSVENSIYKRENDIIEAAADNDILTVSKYKRDINSLRQYGELSSENTLAELEANKQAILSEIGVNKEDMSAEISGVFTTYVDGYENLLRPDDIQGYDVPYFESLSQSPQMHRIESRIEAGGSVCKIVNNHVWYVMTDIPSDVMEGRERGQEVKLRFHNMADTVVDGTIYAISDEQNGRRIVTVKCSTYLENAFSYRMADVDLIFESYDGYRIPVHAIHTEENGKQKVIGISGGKLFDCYCDVLFVNPDGAYAIVNSTDDAENKLSQMDRIRVGER